MKVSKLVFLVAFSYDRLLMHLISDMTIGNVYPTGFVCVLCGGFICWPMFLYICVCILLHFVRRISGLFVFYVNKSKTFNCSIF